MKMGSSAALGFHQMWNEEKHHLKVKHESDIAFLNDLFEKEKQDLREVNEINLQRLKATVPSSLYQELILPMAEKALNYDLRQIENGYKKRTELTQKSHKDQRARQEVAYHEKLRVSMAQTKQSPSATEGSDVSQQKNLEIINGEQRLMMHVRTQPKKRKASASEELPAKRPHLDTSADSSVDSLRTPVPAPIRKLSQQPERTITFDEVYQNGNAKYKHTIVEWPLHSKKWYIVKCEQHSLHFTHKNPIQGAAKHLNGASHGYPDRNKDSTVKALGYRVLGCDETQVRLHNEIVEKAYANGYIPLGFKGNRLEKNRRKQQPNGQVSKGASTSHVADSGPVQGKEITPGRPPTESGRETKDASPPQRGISNPKTFHIYYGYWKVNGSKKGEIYPVMILGWDDQTGSGLEDTDLHDTGLLKKTSHPPSCYKYDSRRIVGWAPGYEDGGPKVELRRFPVMFFDESQTVAWFPAADLLKFPLYKRKAPDRPDDPFNAARRWIAEREGFETWEDREKSRLNALELRPPSSFSKTSGEGRSGNPDPLEDSDDSNGSDSESDAASHLSTETEKMMKQLREKGGEISGDDDYSASTSDIHDYGIDDKDIDENLDCEVEEWIKHHAGSRPWAWYDLRRQDADHSIEGAVDTQEAHEAQETHEIRKEPSITPESTDSQTPHEKPIHDADTQKDNATNVMRSGGRSKRSTSAVDSVAHSSHCQAPSEGTRKRERKSDKEDEGTTSMSSTVPELSSSRFGLPHPSFSTASSNETNPDYELSLFSDGVTSWERANEDEDCLKLFYIADDKKIATRGGLLTVTVDPTEIVSFSREPIAGSNGNSVLALKSKHGLSWRLAFGRSKQSKLETGKIQTHRLIKWLRKWNPGIKCLES